MFEINVFDRYFFGAPSCVLVKTPKEVKYVFRQQGHNRINLFIDVCMYEEAREERYSDSKYRIGLLYEPKGLHPGDYERAPEALKWLDFIITSDAELLKIPGFVKYSPGGIWVPQYAWGFPKKTKMCSFLYGAKVVPMEGYKIRHQIVPIAKEYGVDLFYEIGRSGEAKIQSMRDYRFTIIVEPCRELNWFGTHLLDPIMLGCVPIYWGCPNIEEFMETCGILSFVDLAQLRSILLNLTRKLYNEIIPCLQANQNTSKQWEITEDWIALNILNHLDDYKASA
jgi:hypothetical protein